MSMSEPSSNKWIEAGAAGLRATGQAVRLVLGLAVMASGLGLSGAGAFALAMPDGELLKTYAGAYAAGIGEGMPVLASIIVAGVRGLLLVSLLVAASIVNDGWKLWRSAFGREI